MLRYKIACFGSDLWALGCIIYQCITGRPPFTGKNRFEIEDKINNCEYEFPRGFNKHAKDLVCKLLKPNPTERLGAGAKGSKNSLEALKNHPFFKGKSFRRCHKRTPALHTLKRKVNLQKYRSNYNEADKVPFRITEKENSELTNEKNKEIEEPESPDSVRSMCFETNAEKLDSIEIEETPKTDRKFLDPFEATNEDIIVDHHSKKKVSFRRIINA